MKGKLVKWRSEINEGVLNKPYCEPLFFLCPLLMHLLKLHLRQWHKCFCIITWYFCNLSTTYPLTHPTIFSSLYLGAFRLANPYQSFSFLYKINYLILTLYHPRAQIKLMSSFYFLYLSNDLPRLNCLVRFYSLTINIKFKAWNSQD